MEVQIVFQDLYFFQQPYIFTPTYQQTVCDKRKISVCNSKTNNRIFPMELHREDIHLLLLVLKLSIYYSNKISISCDLLYHVEDILLMDNNRLITTKCSGKISISCKCTDTISIHCTGTYPFTYPADARVEDILLMHKFLSFPTELSVELYFPTTIFYN